ncbi:cytochrome P450 [Rhodococcus sp. WS4]|nr:cytochrome P450 [Rhodococcus sp. WS4]
MTEELVDMAKPQWPFPRTCPLQPPPALDEIREQTPITKVELWDGSAAWLATRYDDVRTLLGNTQLSSDTSAEGFPQSSKTVVSQRSGQKNFARLDPPEHDRQRLMLTADFMVKHVRSLRPYLDQLLDDCFDEMERAAGPVDLVKALAQPVPANIIVQMLDLPPDRSDFFLDRVNQWMSLDSTPEESDAAGAEVLDYFGALINQRKGSSADDLVSRMIRDHLETGDLTEFELQHMLHLLLVGGFDTTANMIALGTLVFLQNPDQWDRIREDPTLVPGAVEELLRYLSVAHHVGFRLAKEDVEIGDTCIHAGDGVIAPIIAANHDPAVFENPHSFDVTRDARRHLAFGYGVHQCLGQALARVELQAVFTKLPQRFPKLALACDFDELRFKNALIYGIEELPVTW